MTAAIKAAQRGKEVFIIERNSKLGKKLALTGNGRCNYWNSNQDLNKYHSSDIKDFVNIYKQKKDEVLDFFKELGIIPRIVNGYYYPFSNQAQSVVNALENKL